jgi:hypothetical protein
MDGVGAYRSIVRLENRIRDQVKMIENELEAWHDSLPPWFSLGDRDISDEDASALLTLPPTDYIHPFIPTVLSCAYAARIQLWRISNPDVEKPPSRIFKIVATLVNMLLQIPKSADLMFIPNIWIAGLFLQNPEQRERLEGQIRKRIEDQEFFLWKFCFHGLAHGWAGKDNIPFISLPENAQEIVPGVSENMFRAEGVMRLIAQKFETEGTDVAEHQGQLYRFPGDTKLEGMESDVSDEE